MGQSCRIQQVRGLLRSKPMSRWVEILGVGWVVGVLLLLGGSCLLGLEETSAAPLHLGQATPSGATLTPTALPICTATWQLDSSPNGGTRFNELYGVAAVAPSEIWAVGQYRVDNTNTFQTLVVRGDGSRWTRAPSPNAGSSED